MRYLLPAALALAVGLAAYVYTSARYADDLAAWRDQERGDRNLRQAFRDQAARDKIRAALNPSPVAEPDAGRPLKTAAAAALAAGLVGLVVVLTWRPAKDTRTA